VQREAQTGGGCNAAARPPHTQYLEGPRPPTHRRHRRQVTQRPSRVRRRRAWIRKRQDNLPAEILQRAPL